ncbi:MAG: hypothetical protein J6Q25_08660 [Bacteroidales bacterium]|nr:hypothetical protein [Bacteroidales bacterium]
MNYPVGTHNIADADLVSATIVAHALGVTDAAVSKAKRIGRISTFENTKGKPLFHLETTKREWYANRNPSKVTTATNGQKAVGLTDFEARLSAKKNFGDDGSPLPDSEVFDFGKERAAREHFAAEMAKIKTDEMKGMLVDKLKASQKVYELASSVKDRLLSIHLKVASAVMAPLENALIDAGLTADVVRNALSIGQVEKVIGEVVRKNVIDSLRDIISKEQDNFV